MKIVHVTGYFADGYGYQENLLPVGQVELGNDVVVVTGINEPDFGFNSHDRRRDAGESIVDGFRLLRLDHYFELTNRWPLLRGLFKKIKQERPDILFIHDVGPALLTGIFYKLIHNKTQLHFDCHSTHDNAANSFFGPLYHWGFKILFAVFAALFDRFFAISPETVDFMVCRYGLDRSRIVLLPLPGDASGLERRDVYRSKVLSDYNLPSTACLIVHSGKLPGAKRTADVLLAFRRLKDPDARLLLVGSVEPTFRADLDASKALDGRIVEVGWLSAKELRILLLSSDLLVQPGSLSNTFIDAICCGLPVLLDNTPQGRFLTRNGNGLLVDANRANDLQVKMCEALTSEMHSKLRAAAIDSAEYYHYRSVAEISLR